jgi:hypothetical protein
MLDAVQRDKQLEGQAIFRIENNYLRVKRLFTYIALEEIDFIWSLEDVHEFDEMWKHGIKQGKTAEELIPEIAEYFGRTHEEIAVLVMDRGMKGKI